MGEDIWSRAEDYRKTLQARAIDLSRRGQDEDAKDKALQFMALALIFEMFERTDPGADGRSLSRRHWM